jgi:hypothetical protein
VPRTEPWLAAKRRFLDAYYRINVAYAELKALRQSSKHIRLVEERPLLQAIERALRHKESVEDRWASRGMIATAHQLDGITVNVAFSHPGSPAARPISLVASTAVKLTFAVPPRARGRT